MRPRRRSINIRVTGLAPDTTHYYLVGNSSTTLASGPTYFFATAPTSARPTRIWVLGDSGTANANARAVRDAYYNFTGNRRTDLWLMLGDNAYNTGTDTEYQAAVFNTYPTLLRNSVLWATLGNHDGATANSTSQTWAVLRHFHVSEIGGGRRSGLWDGGLLFIRLRQHPFCLPRILRN